jgi:GNAT superfamily N-acetyltransferase
VSHRVEALADRHELTSFACGHQQLDAWLRDHAHRATRQGTRTYVLVDETSAAISGYFAIAPHLLERDELPRRIGRGAPQRIPAILLAKLAVDRRWQGRHLGSDLLVEAMTTILHAARVAGGRLIVVDAVDEQAAGFYLAHDFEPLPEHPLRLVMKLSSAAAALGLPWP